jgi:hypothetical protein
VSSPLGPLTSYRCLEFGVLCDGADVGRAPGPRSGCVPGSKDPDQLHQLVPVAQFVGFLRGLKPDPQRLYVAVIAAPPTPVNVGLDGNDYPDQQPACSGPLGTADPGIRLHAFATALGEQAREISICANDMSGAMTTIGADIVARLGP